MNRRNLVGRLKRSYPRFIKLFALLIFRLGLSNHAQRITFYAYVGFDLVLKSAKALPLKGWRLSYILRDVLWELTRLNPVFTLNISVAGAETLIETRRKHGSVLICTGHLGLTLSSHFALHQMGLDPIFVVNFDKGIRDTSGFNWGTEQKVSLIDAQAGNVFQEISKALNRPNSAVVCFVDFFDGGNIYVSPNLFNWAYLKGIPVIFMKSSPSSLGSIHINLQYAPIEVSSTKEEAYICAQSFAELMTKETGAKVIVRKRKT